MPKKSSVPAKTAPKKQAKTNPATTQAASGDSKQIKRIRLPKKLTRKPKEAEVKRAESGARVLQSPKRTWYKPRTWKYRPPTPDYKPLPKARKLFWSALKQIWHYKRLFGGIMLMYGFLNLLLVRGLSGSSDLSTLKSTLDAAAHGVSAKLLSSSLSFTYLLTTSGSGNTASSGVYQGLLLVACSLACIWALRQSLTKHKDRVRTKDSFYLGMYPVVPFILVFLLLSLQVLPLALGAGFYSLVTQNGIAVNLWERCVTGAIALLLGLWSLRMITASIFALYIVTLPDMTPLRAYRSARKLVYRRRLLIWRKLIFLPIILLVLAGAIEIPLIYFYTMLAEWTFFVITMVMLPVIHGYVYNLYREML